MEQSSQCPFFAYEEELDSSMLRLLRRDFSNGNDNLSFTVTTISRIPTPVYTALSYTWGTEEPSDMIYLDGQQFYITKNLCNCLSFVTQDDSTRNEYIWCDAICINQLNVRERNSQVGVMDEIYRDASYVCVWLGLPPHVRSSPGGAVSSNLSDDDGFTWKSSLGELLRHPYWSRAWIIQEFLLAKDVRICCGLNCIGWKDFFWEVWTCDGNAMRGAGFGPFHATMLARARYQLRSEPVSALSSKPQRRTLTLCEALRKYCLTECEDPRDKIFSLLGLLGESEREYLRGLFPDYTLTVKMVAPLTLAHIMCHEPEFDVDAEHSEVSSVFVALGMYNTERRALLRYAKKLARWLDLQLGRPGMGKGPYPVEFKLTAATIIADNKSKEEWKGRMRSWLVWFLRTCGY